MNIQSECTHQITETRSKKSMLKDIAAIAIPCVIAMFSQMLVESINLAFVGHLGDQVLVAGVGLGNMYINTMGFAVLIGLNTTICTLASQSYGQGNLKLCGIYLNRGRIVGLAACVPIIIIMLLAEEFFLLLQIDQRTSAVAQLYITWITPVIIALSQFDITRQFLNSFEKSHITMILHLITTPFHLLWCYILVNIFELGIIGTALATNLTFLINLTSLTLYISYFEEDLKEAWFFPNRDSLIGLMDYLKMGIPAMIMMCLEWWTFELQTFIASFISIEATGTQVIILNTLYVLFSIVLGLQYSAQALIGKAIGAQDIKEAKVMRTLHQFIGVIVAFVMFSILYFFRTQIANFYTNIELLQGMVIETLKVVAIAEFFDCLQGWQQGIIRGLGMFNHAMFGQFISFYLICIPLGYVFGFHLGMELNGIWYGFLIGLVILSCYYFYLTMFHFDWYKIAEATQERSKLENARCDMLNEAKNEDLRKPLIDF